MPSESEPDNFDVVLDQIVCQIHSITGRLERLGDEVPFFMPVARTLIAALCEMERLLPPDDSKEDNAAGEAEHKATIVAIAAKRVMGQRGGTYEDAVHVVLAAHPEMARDYSQWSHSDAIREYRGAPKLDLVR